jgi:hypothetical protein
MRAEGPVSPLAEAGVGSRRIPDQMAPSPGPEGDRAVAGSAGAVALCNQNAAVKRSNFQLPDPQRSLGRTTASGADVPKGSSSPRLYTSWIFRDTLSIRNSC